ncbi:amylo-alpha-1,6-glucosidase [Burkholderia pseudomallei 305]|nr:amylo-alpha-1,6-glucosidase [Burkholderia pseudomallei 305]EXI97903.1 amylo-alpha-1,6-glucosidase [Burkholderia pseudomallei MSHR6137]
MRIALSAGGRYSGVTLYLPHAARHRHRRIRYPVFGIRSLASGVDTSGIAPAWPFPQLLLASLWTS